MDREMLAAIGDMLDKKLDEKLDAKLEPIGQDITGLKQDMTGVRQDITGMKQDMTGVRQDITGLDKRVSLLQEQNEKISITVIDILNAVHDLGAGQAKLGEGQFRLQSEIGDLRRGQERIEARLDRVETMAEVTRRDHETRIRVLESKTPA